MKINLLNKKIIVVRAILFSIVFLFCTFSFAQNSKKGKNLVPNPSFETHKNKSNRIKNAVPWSGIATVDTYTATSFSTAMKGEGVDYYMKPDKRDTSRYRGAHTGTCYAGLKFQHDYKDYLFVQLTEPLEKDSTYHYKMYVRLLQNSKVTGSVKQLGVFFTNEAFKIAMNFEQEGIIDSTYKKGIFGTYNWIPIQGDYIAHGGEKFILIGNFRTKIKDDIVKKNKMSLFESSEAYYYLDDVSVRKKIGRNDPAKNIKAIKEPAFTLPDSLVVGQVVEIKNVQFENGSAKLLRTSYKVLDELVRSLDNHPFMEIQINGYTDNKGNEATNKKLSKERAKAVYDYLKAEGVVSPMTYRGFGGTKPIAPNDTDENIAKNRRIEFVVTKQ
jgi:OOP family OmpA-OmpF porin